MQMLLLAVFNILLSRLSGQEDIIVGTSVAGRRHADLEKIIGVFINTLALRNFPSGEKKFLEFLREVKENALGAYENQEYPFEDLVNRVVSRRDTSRNPLFDAMFEMRKLGEHEEVGERAGMSGLSVKPYRLATQGTKFDLDWMGLESADRIFFTVVYCAALFEESTIAFMVNCFRVLLGDVLAKGDAKIKELNHVMPGKGGQKKKKEIEFKF